MFKRILMPIDLQETDLAAKAVQITIDEAKKHGATVHVMTVLPGFGMPMVASFFPDKTMKKALKQVGSELKHYITANFPDEIKVKAVITEGNPAERILAQATKLDADLIIIPSHAQSLGQVFLGSCAAKVVEHAHCSVMVIKG